MFCFLYRGVLIDFIVGWFFFKLWVGIYLWFLSLFCVLNLVCKILGIFNLFVVMFILDIWILLLLWELMEKCGLFIGERGVLGIYDDFDV